MKRRFLILALVAVFALVGLGVQSAQAVAGDYINFWYLGGGMCYTDGVSMPVGYSGNFSVAYTYTTTIRWNGAVVDQWTGSDGPADSGSGTSDYGWGWGSPQSFPFTYQWQTRYPGLGTFTLNAVCKAAGSAPVVSTADTSAEGRDVPSSFVLRTITCDVGVFDAPAGKAVGSAAIKGGQTWFVNPAPVVGADGQSWTEIFVSGSANGYVPTACVN